MSDCLSFCDQPLLDHWLDVYLIRDHPHSGLLWWLSAKDSACQYRRCGFNPWAGEMPWRDFLLLEEEMAAHSSILAWRIPWAEEPGGQQYLGSWRVCQNWATDLQILTYHIPLSREVEILMLLIFYIIYRQILRIFYLYLWKTKFSYVMQSLIH